MESQSQSENQISRKKFLRILISVVITLVTAAIFFLLADLFGYDVSWATPTIGLVALLSGLEVMAHFNPDFEWEPIFSHRPKIVGFIIFVVITISLNWWLNNNEVEFTWPATIFVGLIAIIWPALISIPSAQIAKNYR